MLALDSYKYIIIYTMKCMVMVNENIKTTNFGEPEKFYKY